MEASVYKNALAQMESTYDLSNKKLSEPIVQAPVVTATAQSPEALGVFRTIGTKGFTGEKNLGELGSVRSYFIDYETLRARSWQLFLESDIAQMILKKQTRWVIGNGLKLQAIPDEDVIASEGYSIDRNSFSKSIEARFRVYSRSRMSDYSDMVNLNKIEARAHKNAKVGGDVLVVLRYNEKDKCVTVQLIDGVHLQSPPGSFGNELYPIPQKNGNFIVHGIEIDATGKHVAYHVNEDWLRPNFVRIPARGQRTEMMMSFMVYGNEYRLDNHRGMPLLSVMFETMKQLERYKTATLGSAEERQKIVYSIRHEGPYSTGEKIFTREAVRAVNNMSIHEGYVPVDDYGNQLADRMAASTNKQTWNLPVGAHLEALESKNELYFKDFYETNIKVFCAAVDMPYEVALSSFNSNYSASRAAIKDWEHAIMTDREEFSMQFLMPIYAFMLEVEILNKKIKGANGYIKALVDENRMAMEAYRTCRFVGPNVPHVDPKKESEAIRLNLGAAGGNIPLMTAEEAVEQISGAGADSDAIIEQFATEFKKVKGLGIKPDEPPVPAFGGGGKPAKKKANDEDEEID